MRHKRLKRVARGLGILTKKVVREELIERQPTENAKPNIGTIRGNLYQIGDYLYIKKNAQRMLLTCTAISFTCANPVPASWTVVKDLSSSSNLLFTIHHNDWHRFQAGAKRCIANWRQLKWKSKFKLHNHQAGSSSMESEEHVSILRSPDLEVRPAVEGVATLGAISRGI